MSDLPEQQTADFAALKARAPAGWTLFTAPESFTAASGPYFFRDGDEPGTAFFAEKRHQNLAGIVHGGALATLADMALWNICRRSIGPFRGVTVTLNTSVDTIVSTLLGKRISCLPVVDGKQVVGVVSLSDLAVALQCSLIVLEDFYKTSANYCEVSKPK